jgi:cell division protein FtsI (penicillin-binding protein 3)
MSVSAETLPSAPAEPWRRRLLRSLLYGRNSNRAAKARARVGLAIIAFAVVY